MTPAATGPFRIGSPCGLSVTLNGNSSIQRIEHGDVLINLFPGNELEGGPANVYLRVNGVAAPLLGPRSASTFGFDRDRVTVRGAWHDIDYEMTLTLGSTVPSWFWHVSVHNNGSEAASVDLVYAQDIGLCSYWSARNNEYYVSQYVDHTPLEHRERGILVASRQNQAVNGRNPWCVIGALGRGASFATDALQVFGLSCRGTSAGCLLANGLPGVRHQHEHSMVAVQDETIRLAPGEGITRGFFGAFVEHHPDATSKADLAMVDQAMNLSKAHPQALAPLRWQTSQRSLFTAPMLESRDLTEADLDALWGENRRELEMDETGSLLSFFTAAQTHVVLKSKELRVLRPHGHMLRTGTALTPDESSLTSTVWMSGIFHSLVTQGHVGINRLISTTRSYLGLFRSHGMRIFAEVDGGWRLLDVPSAFEMSPAECRWIYKHAGGVIEVRSVARERVLCLRIDVTSGLPSRFLISTRVAANGDDGKTAEPLRFSRTESGVFIRTVPESDLGTRFPDGGFAIETMKETAIEQIGGDELLFHDGESRRLPYVCFVAKSSTSVALRIVGHLVASEASALDESGDYWDAMTSKLRVHPPVEAVLAREVRRIAEMLPWFAHNALIHYLAPRGLEQFSGGGWGTRDVTQGPVEMLLALGETGPVRDLLTRVFSQQNADGDWPQWFMFFDRERNIRPADSHGDIVFWPLLALAQYLLASGDKSFLDEPLPFFTGEAASVLSHVDRALNLIETRVIPKTQLAAYGHGDWNDSLQPADPRMRERLCSSWTVTLHYQTLQTLASAFARIGFVERSVKLLEQAALVLDDFQRLLVVDEVIAGYAYFHDEGGIDYLLHPRDKQSGVKYSALPMIHALANGMLTPEQAEHHLELIEEHLLAPDGIRLFDKPLPYRGGLMKFFQRAETATFFGREIGLMYTHAHLRFVEALARYGDAEMFFDQLCRAIPIGIRERVPTATPRQSNSYYSSSDAMFKDRYEASEKYAKAMKGEIAYEGGWRIYSSGAGISMALILRCMLGLRRERARLVVDPVIPKQLNGLRIEIELLGRPFEITYQVGDEGCGVNSLTLNGTPLPFDREANPYRTGGAEVAMVPLVANLTGRNTLVVSLG